MALFAALPSNPPMPPAPDGAALLTALDALDDVPEGATEDADDDVGNCTLPAEDAGLVGNVVDGKLAPGTGTPNPLMMLVY